MKKRNIFFLLAALLNLATALIHLIGGQITLVAPLLNSSLSEQQQTEWLGVWHMVSLLLLSTTLGLFRIWTHSGQNGSLLRPEPIAWLYLGVGGVFLAVSAYMGILAPQWVLLLPIGLLVLWGVQTEKRLTRNLEVGELGKNE